jgi:hypothetical protein
MFLRYLVIKVNGRALDFFFSFVFSMNDISVRKIQSSTNIRVTSSLVNKKKITVSEKHKLDSISMGDFKFNQ